MLFLSIVLLDLNLSICLSVYPLIAITAMNTLSSIAGIITDTATIINTLNFKL